MWVIFGQNAFSEFRAQKILAKLKASGLPITHCMVQFVYFVDSTHDLSPEDKKTIENLIQHEGYPASLSFINEWTSLVVVPRIGTVSPWSSKATDIAHQCGVTDLLRIERGLQYHVDLTKALTEHQRHTLLALIHDPLTQTVLDSTREAQQLFQEHLPAALIQIPLLEEGLRALVAVNNDLGLALSHDEMEYLFAHYKNLERNPTDVELMMFAQANSEHCRHKIFNARWFIDGIEQPHSLFDMIRYTHKSHPDGTLVAYKDNAAVISGHHTEYFTADPEGKFCYSHEAIPLLMKVETHNHPTAISPYAGAATGAGGEIRDEGATGRGGKPKAGLVGYSVSALRIPGFLQPWESVVPMSPHLSTPLDIMIDAPLGAAAFGNEFGRPTITGYFRTFFQADHYRDHMRGYHKPIMIAGGLGTLKANHIEKKQLKDNIHLIVLGGPGFAIGLGGGAASSQVSGSQNAQLDFASVQRDNAEMERRCQEVIDRCCAYGYDNPILSIHDVGAGGLSNAIPEILHDNHLGGTIDLRAIDSADHSMSPLAIWCNEAQERYVLAIASEKLTLFADICQRERCPYAVVGQTQLEENLTVVDPLYHNKPIDIPMSLLFGSTPTTECKISPVQYQQTSFDIHTLDLTQVCKRLLQFPACASKNFLITINDRSVGGVVSRDQMVGPWQVPVSNVGVTNTDYKHYSGEAMAMGERSPLALLNPAASARMAVAEAVTNISAALIDKIQEIKLSANWMAAASQMSEKAALFEAVKAVGLELCPALGLSIPVGKDSLSMQTKWSKDEKEYQVTSPMSLIISAFAPVSDIRKTLTPELDLQRDNTLLLIDLGHGKNRLGGAAICQVYNEMGMETPDLDNPEELKQFFAAIQMLNREQLLLAYHDRSDGGLFLTLCEMAFAAHAGLTIELGSLGGEWKSALFTEELGAVIQVATSSLNTVFEILKLFHLQHCTHVLGKANKTQKLVFRYQDKVVYENTRMQCQTYWAETSYRIQALRDNPDCAKQEFETQSKESYPGLHVYIANPDQLLAPMLNLTRPKMAILREQGVNGQLEMAAAFERAGFDCFDIHMTDILSGRIRLTTFNGLAACGGFSYGDVLGAGQGWGKSILYHARARDEFAAFFARTDNFTLGVCNGCQMLAHIRELIPGTDHWPVFVKNISEQYEARFVMVEVPDSPSLLLKNLVGSRMPVVVAHGEGRAYWHDENDFEKANHSGLVSLRYVDNEGHRTERFPENPSGTPAGIAGLTNQEGRVTILMPHPERVFRSAQWSWRPDDAQEDSIWMQLFYNARTLV